MDTGCQFSCPRAIALDFQIPIFHIVFAFTLNLSG